MQFVHNMPFGARLLRTGGAEFALWAPAAKSAALLCDPLTAGGAGCKTEFLAQRDHEGWWRAGVADARAGYAYQWRIDDELVVPDPASRSNPGGPHQPSVLVDPEAYTWRHQWRGRPWEEMVFYELHVGTFTEAGTLAAATERLPYLASLGFTAVELMPLASFAGDWGWGYDGVLPYAPHAAYGSPDDLKRFVDTAHSLGLCVVLDVVYNHFGPDGNYLGAYAPQFFSEQHTSPWGKAINFDQAGSHWVREFFIHNALYWITEYCMDGLRLDAVHAIVDDSEPDVLQELRNRVEAAAATQGRDVHLVLENEKNETRRLRGKHQPQGYDAQWNDDFHHALHVAITSESQGYYAKFAQHQPFALLGRILTDGFAFSDGAEVPGGPPVHLPHLLNFAGNHDQVGNRAFGERLRALAGDEAGDLALVLSLLTPSIPMVFMGDEFGAATPFQYFANWTGELRSAVQEGRMREFGHVAGAEPLPDPCAAGTFAASRLDWDQAATQAGQARTALVTRALQARRLWLQPRSALLKAGGHTAERVGSTGLRVRWQYEDGTALRMEVNLGPAVIQPSTTAPGGERETHAREVFAHHCSAEPEEWAPWSARWTLEEAAP